jgi:hypothetical protein
MKWYFPIECRAKNRPFFDMYFATNSTCSQHISKYVYMMWNKYNF